MSLVKHALLGASLTTMVIANQAYAQTAAPPAGAAVADIVVTANKREQRLNDVGITVAVLSGNALQRQQINSLADLANATPSLSFTNSANGTPVYTLRGVGFYETSLGAYPTVSTYVDEAPLPFPVLSSHSAYDLERVEVLKVRIPRSSRAPFRFDGARASELIARSVPRIVRAVFRADRAQFEMWRT